MADEKPLTRKTLDKMRCETPGCAHKNHSPVIILHARCHVSAATWARYNIKTGILTIECAVCRMNVAELVIAD